MLQKIYLYIFVETVTQNYQLIKEFTVYNSIKQS